MHISIDPTVDCVFKALLGSEHRVSLLIHFLNGVLEDVGDRRVVSATISNPFNPRDFKKQKLSVVDVKAEDEQGRIFQIEVQVHAHNALPERMLYTWANMYHHRLKKGEDYTKLTRVTSIWLLVEDLFPDLDRVHTRFGIYSPEAGRYLSDQCSIHLLQLNKLAADIKIETELQRWLKFFRDAKNIDLENIPDWLETPEMKEAVDVLRSFTEQEQNLHLYLSRLDQEREAATQKALVKQREEKYKQEIELERQGRMHEAEGRKREREARLHVQQEMEKYKQELEAIKQRLKTDNS